MGNPLPGFVCEGFPQGDLCETVVLEWSFNMRKGNIIAGLICAALAVYVICSVGLIVVTLMMKKDQFPELPMWTPGTKRVYISMAILLVYMLVLSTLGFIIPSVIMLFAFCQWFHKGAFWKNALISVIVVLAIYFVFKNFLNVPIDFGMFSI